MEKEDIHTLISKYFDGKCSQEEIVSIYDWCNLSEKNKKEFIQLKTTWVISDKKSEENILSSLPHIWNNIISEISQKAPKMYTRRSLVYYTAITAAASILLIFCLNFFTDNKIWNSHTEYTYFYMARGEKGQLFLPDGTKVWLNSDSKLRLGSDFNARNRAVFLEGEAFFDVAKSDKHSFIVQTNSVDVKVLGTAFKVTAYTGSDDVGVSLQRGSVSIYKRGTEEKLATLVPSQHASIKRKSFLTEIDWFDDEANIAWTFEELIYEHAPFKEVFAKMGNWYGVDISVVLPPSQPDLRYRFKIKSESLTEILELINKMTPIDYKINGKEVIIRYK
ncbi:transmembrane sensor [Dysgonomonas sp. PFB1-18]|uniref:FecR family protein n=1 Tax=unclassified Dysgonomonas TaxID=2630389 RepID=UPI002475942F|nr:MULTISPECIES: FecR domain-containing protein [unclassified Dysgonomonas]MDL2303192.1 FecR domain-containing protein [Dysgonomonas sp. OttesenSCG-928-D17]MDH6308786.1 transmembrane sensor [Dysgonomonas sp. PF1-14]MDH6338517.1 transmembrane sensor [Dysgonomonas sp. PF1-16]MDH6380035.1 transmembrane sensor [Dysgonomonas sp. PFB1-18]MDH6397345.1 transmembrane sensor [Dysgonomonas sp. PF1-23]